MSSVPISQVPNVTKEVAKKFHALRLKFLLAHIATAILLSLAGWMLLWFCLAVIDYFLEIHFNWRQLAMFSGIGIALLFAFVRLSRHLRNSRVRAFAALLEVAFESFGQRIRTVLDTVDGKVSGPSEMLAALGHQTLGRWETLVPSQILPKRLFIGSCVLCAITVAVTLASLLGQGEWRTAMLRTIGYEIPYTTLSVQPGSLKVLEGKDVDVSLTLAGRQNRAVQLRYRFVTDEDRSPESSQPSLENEVDDQSNWLSSDVERGDSGGFAYAFGPAKVPIEYQFVTSVGKSDTYRIDVQPLIEALRTEVHVVPPSYTGLEPRTFTSGEATVLERSTVTVKVETNHPLKAVQLEVGARPSKLASAEAAIVESGTEVTFELPSASSLHWRLNATGLDGTPMTTLKGRLRVREDAVPSIRWQDPHDEIRVHTLAELPMRAHVSDDYGVVETGIMFRIGDGDEYELTMRSIDQLTDESNKITTSLLLDELLPLESLSLTERDYLSYYAFAVDNREWGNQRVETDVRYIDIRPLRQFFSERDADPNANGGDRLLVQLDEIIRRQRHLINRSRKMEKSGASQATDNLKVIDRMVEAESELAGLTRFLAEFLVSRGNDDVEALNQAEASLLQASDSLSAVNLPLALTHEEDALRSLSEARRELEIVFTKSSMAQQRQFSQVARQLQQKLRREAAQTELQIADSFEQIANEQMQLSEQMFQACQANSASASASSVGQGSASNPPDETNEASAREQREEWFSRELELLERVQSIEGQLSSRLEKATLMAERMREVKADMGALSKMARNGEHEPFQEGSRDTSDKLRELSVQLKALAASEAVNRVSSLRDMTLSMAERERDLLDATQRLASSSSSSTSQESMQSGSDSSGSLQARAARRLARRAATIVDVLATPPDVGDVAMSEVNDAIEKFVASNEFSDKLSQSQSVGEELSEGSADSAESTERGSKKQQDTPDATGKTPSDQALERARDYADAAGQLESLYRQLVSPRIARLKQLEQQASQLNQQLAGQGERSQTSMNEQAKVGQLQRELKQEGMGSLADVLDTIEEGSMASGHSRYGLPSSSTLNNRVEVVVKELREQIQELILLEVAADRDAPVPAVYRTAVDGYFRAISGESQE